MGNSSIDYPLIILNIPTYRLSLLLKRRLVLIFEVKKIEKIIEGKGSLRVITICFLKVTNLKSNSQKLYISDLPEKRWSKGKRALWYVYLNKIQCM